MSYTVRQVVTESDLKTFIHYPLNLYRDVPLFVPHLLKERKKFFSRSNPIFKFTDVAYFIAHDARGKTAGRVTAHINHRANQTTRGKTGYFGFFECTDDIEAASRLMQAAEEWLRSRGMSVIQGPFNFSTNDECGFLAQGFDRPPVIMMPYTQPYYLDFMDHLGYVPAKDLLTYEYIHGGFIPEYLVHYSHRVQQRNQVNIRALDMRRFEEEVAAAFQIYNSAWEENWGFVSMTEAEFDYAAHEFKPIIEPSLVLVAEKEGRMVGLSLSLPDYNVVLRKMKGRLFPSGFLHFLFGRRSIRHIRVILLGVLREYRRSGIDLLLIENTFRNAMAKGYLSGDLSWILEDNLMMRRALDRMGATVSKIHRIYEKKL
jgi:GNAT superfamily N-acetyltransferase